LLFFDSLHRFGAMEESGKNYDFFDSMYMWNDSYTYDEKDTSIEFTLDDRKKLLLELDTEDKQKTFANVQGNGYKSLGISVSWEYDRGNYPGFVNYDYSTCYAFVTMWLPSRAAMLGGRTTVPVTTTTMAVFPDIRSGLRKGEKYPISVYIEKNKAREYCRRKVSKRVFDLQKLIDGICKKSKKELVFIGDACGFGQMAAKGMGFRRVYSFDSSKAMTEVATEYGNSVSELTFDDLFSKYGRNNCVDVIFVISHVLDYIPSAVYRLLLMGAKVLVHERHKYYHGCAGLRRIGNTMYFGCATNMSLDEYDGFPGLSSSYKESLIVPVSINLQTMLKYTNLVFVGNRSLGPLVWWLMFDVNRQWRYRLVSIDGQEDIVSKYKLLPFEVTEDETLVIIDSRELCVDVTTWGRRAVVYDLNCSKTLESGFISTTVSTAGTLSPGDIALLSYSDQAISHGSFTVHHCYITTEDVPMRLRQGFPYLFRNPMIKEFMNLDSSIDYAGLSVNIHKIVSTDLAYVVFNARGTVKMQCNCIHAHSVFSGSIHVHVFEIASFLAGSMKQNYFGKFITSMPVFFTEDGFKEYMVSNNMSVSADDMLPFLTLGLKLQWLGRCGRWYYTLTGKVTQDIALLDRKWILLKAIQYGVNYDYAFLQIKNRNIGSGLF